MEALFNTISRYIVKAECVQPLHIGSGENNEDILTRKTDGKPFIQGTSLAGVFSAYVEACRSKREAEKYFGSRENDTKSNIVFSEGDFDSEKPKIEMRTRVSIDGATSSVQKNNVKGTKKTSGQLMDVEYVSAGSRFSFSICCMDDSDEIINDCLSALDKGIITIGGKSTIGCGQVKVISVKEKQYDMANDDDRNAWEKLSISDMSGNGYDNKTEDIRNIIPQNPYYEIYADIYLRTPMLIKANAVKRSIIEKAVQSDETGKLPDNMPIANGNDEFIIPGSSLKGVFRSRMEAICDYLNISSDIVKKTFSEKSDCLFSDSIIVGSEEGITDAVIQPRIHINKISGSVMNKQLMSEVIISGKSKIHIRVPKKTSNEALSPKAVIGLILFVLRDMEIGAVTIGSGAGIGRGYISVKDISIDKGKEEKKCTLNFKEPNRNVNDEFVRDCIEAVKSANGGAA